MALLILTATGAAFSAEPVRCVEPDAATGSSAAVVVGDVPLVHTSQHFSTGDESAPKQIRGLLARLQTTLENAGSGLDRCVKLNVYLPERETIALVQSEFARTFKGAHKPAVAFIVTPLADPHAIVAADAVATTTLDPGRTIKVFRTGENRESDAADPVVSIIPNGTRIYVSGQAARSESLGEATRGTLAQLRETLRFLGRREADIVQVKCFLQPMADANVVRSEIAAFFGSRPVPPVSLVEWQSGATVPIEIEIVAFGGKNRTGDTLEFLTPPGLKASPVFSRVARIHHSKSIYVSGLYAAQDSSETVGEVEQVFGSLNRILKESGSDLRHLVKATYYVSTDSASRRLNELRPDYYDPARPPAASKARVADVGIAGLGLTLDMIAVPAVNPVESEYGPPEFGHGLTAKDAEAGWISLFDGETTYGWKGATVSDGVLSGGRTTAMFRSFEIRAEAKTAGSILIGDSRLSLPGGHFEGIVDRKGDAAAIQLGEGLQLQRIAIRPRGVASIFNARDFAGWKEIHRANLPPERRPKWTIEDGVIRAAGGPGCLEFQGGQFGDLVLQLDVRTGVRHANGGVFFRSIRGDFMNGYEAQIFNRSENGDPSRPARWCTGGIDDRQNARRMVSRDGTFFRMTIIANGPHLATWVNGHQQVDWTDTRELHDNPREGRREKPGAIQLQAHDPETDVEFRRISVDGL